ncbi:alpha/beta hydrolase [Defluviitalea phaphyphila]|uniref:alpha/beta hydrolase n=1 Tax=Defluviitalea phaphyphila TaxID=1473580 RepID=UPI0007312E7C|nr:alpha/beta hydrolase [Defluviitalea phaphyphila]
MNLLYKYFINSDNLRIFYIKDVPFDPKAIILISHGYGEHSGHYTELANFLIKNKYGVYGIDHRSHGRSEGVRGHIDSFFEFTSDFHELVSIIKKEHPNTPIFTFGHSMGGLISFAYALIYKKDNIKGQIFSGPALGAPWGLYRVPTKLYEILGKTIPKAKIYNIIKGKRVSRNIKYVSEFKKNPFDLRYSTVSLLSEFLYKGMSWVQDNAENYDIPCLFLHGKADRIIPYHRTSEIYNKIKSEDKTLKLYENCYHELIHEPEREEIMSDILDWLEERIN